MNSPPGAVGVRLWRARCDAAPERSVVEVCPPVPHNGVQIVQGLHASRPDQVALRVDRRLLVRAGRARERPPRRTDDHAVPRERLHSLCANPVGRRDVDGVRVPRRPAKADGHRPLLARLHRQRDPVRWDAHPFILVGPFGAVSRHGRRVPGRLALPDRRRVLTGGAAARRGRRRANGGRRL